MKHGNNLTSQLLNTLVISDLSPLDHLLCVKKYNFVLFFVVGHIVSPGAGPRREGTGLYILSALLIRTLTQIID